MWKKRASGKQTIANDQCGKSIAKLQDTGDVVRALRVRETAM
jgi:hypothetical protein